MKNKPSVYIAGPITGVPKYWEAFEAADDELSGLGFAVISPARLPLGLRNEQYARINMASIDAVDIVLFLPGWQKSKGAILEKAYCEYIGKPVAFSVDELLKELET